MMGRVANRCLVGFFSGALVAIWSIPLSGQRPTPDWAESLPDASVVKKFIASQVQANWEPPKTPWGDPDIQGNFTTKDEANTPFERPLEWTGRTIDKITTEELAADIVERQQRALETAPFAGGGEPDQGVAIAVPIHWFDNLAAQNARPWFVIDPIDGAIPPLTSGEPGGFVFGGGATRGGDDRETRLRGGHRNSYTDRYLGDRCIMWASGVPHFPIIYGNSFQILQTADHVVVRYEMIHEARIIPLDGRPHPNSAIRSYMGDSRAYWDGNSLVVETTNVHEAANYLGAPGKNVRLVERFTRIAPQKVEWTMTLDDTTTWQRPWTYSRPMTEDDTQIIHEYACHEGNYGMANLLSAARAQERQDGER